MEIVLHKLASTTPRIREEIRKSELSGPQLAKKYGISLDTVYKWKKREEVTDRSHVRHNLGTKISKVEEEIIKAEEQDRVIDRRYNGSNEALYQGRHKPEFDISSNKTLRRVQMLLIL